MKRKLSRLPALTTDQHARLQKLLQFKQLGEEGVELAKDGTKASQLRALVEERVRLRSPFLWVEAEDPMAPMQWLDGITGPTAAILLLKVAHDLPAEVKRHLHIATLGNLRVCLETIVIRQRRRADTCMELQEAHLVAAAEAALLQCLPDAASRETLRKECLPLWSDAVKELWSFFHMGRCFVASQYRGQRDKALVTYLQRTDFFRAPTISVTGNEEQRLVARLLLEQLRRHGWSVLSGCGGAGKTFILSQLALAMQTSEVPNDFASVLRCPLCDDPFVGLGCGCGFRRSQAPSRALRLVFVAPTNRAVAVLRAALSAASGRSEAPRVEGADGAGAPLCCTLHALSCLRHEAPIDVLVADESSMLASEHGDIITRCSALKRAALLLVGDDLQLTPVAPGEIFRPLLKLAGLPGLETNLRAAGPLQRPIAAIRRGQAAEATAFATTVATDLERHRRLFQEAVLDVEAGARPPQVLALRNEDRIEYCRYAIRQRLDVNADDDDYANGKPNPFAFTPFVGEPVRFQNNKFKPQACRGSLGAVVAVEVVAQRPKVAYRLQVELPSGELVQLRSSHAALGFDLRPAFAITVHDSQGGEFDDVHVLLPPSPTSPLCTLEMLYTAASRARRSLRFWCVGSAFEQFEEALAKKSALRAMPLRALLHALKRDAVV